ncbi:MAG: hypothetical protein CM15mP98_03850 [Paracoccaceae bacterium]|nr:MAG: hypothetical protein CM15mP98_03850 [Paracoccaceae bacterium]
MNSFLKCGFSKIVTIFDYYFLGWLQFYNVGTSSDSEFITDIGNTLFIVFSILYLLNSFFLIKFNRLSSLTYLPMVLLFVFLGFLSEILNPMQIKQDYFFLVVFYIISPLFFIMQGMVLSMLNSKSVKEIFSDPN